MRTLVVDYGRGNLFSLSQALRHLDADHEVSDDPKKLEQADRIIFPGVGAFGDAIQGLASRGLVEPLKAAMEKGTPVLGICVGCQLLLTKSEEFGEHLGLDVIPGVVRRLPDPAQDKPPMTRIPNVGWRQLNVRKSAPVLGGIEPDDLMYFVHSYAPIADREEDIAATIPVNGVELPIAVHRENLLGVQFHPEKSGPSGLKFLAGYFEWADTVSPSSK